MRRGERHVEHIQQWTIHPKRARGAIGWLPARSYCFDKDPEKLLGSKPIKMLQHVIRVIQQNFYVLLHKEPSKVVVQEVLTALNILHLLQILKLFCRVGVHICPLLNDFVSRVEII
jgi:hypothetical protein